MLSKIKENTRNIIICLGEFIIGILLFINPIDFTSGIIIVGGILLLCMGLGNIVSYFRKEVSLSNRGLSTGIIYILLGGFCILQYQWFIDTFTIITMLYGAVMLVVGIDKIQWGADLKRNKRKYWYYGILDSFLTIFLAIVILMSSSMSSDILWIILALSLVVIAIFDLVTIILGAKEKYKVEIVDEVKVEEPIQEDEPKEESKEKVEEVDEEDILVKDFIETKDNHNEERL
ncbi:MAG: DUF308 domain-containing protein [Erysipelotrichaceae bacterium]|nr:DUF308 domain-containing protein [Erysipelotrichaceae bacterium]